MVLAIFLSPFFVDIKKTNTLKTFFEKCAHSVERDQYGSDRDRDRGKNEIKKPNIFQSNFMELVDYVDGDNQLYLLYSEFNLTFLLPFASTFYILYFRVAMLEFIIQKYCSF